MVQKFDIYLENAIRKCFVWTSKIAVFAS